MAKDEKKIRVQNVVATAWFKQTFDLNDIANAFPWDTEFKGRFPGLVFKLKKPKTTMLIFKTGKIVCTGAKGEREAKRAIRKVARELRKGGIVITDKRPEIKIVNIVASTNLGRAVDLIGLYEAGREFRGRILYEPEQFPAAIYRMEDPHVVFLIFSSGKLVCAGAKQEEEVHETVEKLAAILEERGVLLKEA